MDCKWFPLVFLYLFFIRACACWYTCMSHAIYRRVTSVFYTNATSCSVCIVSILRLQSLVAISNSSDQTYDNPPAATWSSVETNVGIICACLPLLRPLLAKYFPRAFPSRHRSQYSRPNYPAAYGSKGGSKILRSKNEYVLDGTKRSRESNDETRDIQVVTDIHVQVEGSGGVQMSGWKTQTPNPHWDDSLSAKDAETASTSEMLVEAAPLSTR